jgi:hypothetical protein
MVEPNHEHHRQRDWHSPYRGPQFNSGKQVGFGIK